MSNLFAELEWRGFVHHATQGIGAHLADGRRTAYCGFDPTAPSLQLGNLMPIMLLRHFQLAGHKPIVLMGGGTGLIGDPSGKRNERPLLSKEQIRENLQRQRDQMAKLLDFDGPAQALVLNNADWLVKQSLVDFLRDVGKHFSVNIMLQKESVKARLDAGISYTEFSYMLLQAYDFLHLFRDRGCTIQVGGSDQWGNITAGIDLIRRVAGGEAHGLVAPLVTMASGAKFGKTEAGAIYLDPALTSPYKFYQFWYNVDDRDVEAYLKLFTLLPRPDIEGQIKTHKNDPSRREAQAKLAIEATTMVHGKQAAYNATAVNAILFSDLDPRQVEASALDLLAREIPTARVPSSDGLSLVDAVVQAGLAKSKSEARRAIEQGGIYVNQQRVKDPARKIAPPDWLTGGNLLLRKGKKDYALLRAGR
ncbi:MAG: tyrosine--tRNA ligase [Gemmatimonadetes bacterium]|nr:MAG: tyrosine--tRNA ligase [Gemmatimonadota bacterium]TLY56618.1 MAG: tyrosine--tRNA ligase [Gemmatimonadota bacterium]